jgi:hypothetical protein
MCLDKLIISAAAALAASSIVTLIGAVFEYGYFLPPGAL